MHYSGQSEAVCLCSLGHSWQAELICLLCMGCTCAAMPRSRQGGKLWILLQHNSSNARHERKCRKPSRVSNGCVHTLSPAPQHSIPRSHQGRPLVKMNRSSGPQRQGPHRTKAMLAARPGAHTAQNGLCKGGQPDSASSSRTPNRQGSQMPANSTQLPISANNAPLGLHPPLWPLAPQPLQLQGRRWPGHPPACRRALRQALRPALWPCHPPKRPAPP